MNTWEEALIIQFGSFLVSALVVLALVGGPDSDDDFIVPDDYVGPAIENSQGAEELEPGFEIVDWFDPKGPPVGLFAEEFGLEAEDAAALLRWQDEVTGFLPELRALRSFRHAEIVNPSPDGVGGLHVWLHDPSPSAVALFDSLPAPDGGSNQLHESATILAEATDLADAEEGAPTVANVGEALRLPDGTKVTVEGFITSPRDGLEELLLVDVLLDGFSDDLAPLYDAWLVLRGVDTDTLDFFTYPGGSSPWADDYNVTGTMQNGELHAESLELLLINPERQWVADCKAFLAGTTDELGQCPPRWVDPLE